MFFCLFKQEKNVHLDFSHDFDQVMGVSSNRVNQLGGVGPVDNRPSTSELQHFMRKKKVTCDM